LFGWLIGWLVGWLIELVVLFRWFAGLLHLRGGGLAGVILVRTSDTLCAPTSQPTT
jgi:hypothetical protein